MPKAGLGARVPIWITENGVATGRLSDRQQAAALAELVRASRDYGTTFNLTDYRWFNLRDSIPAQPTPAVDTTFAYDGLLRADYTRKLSFTTYRRLIAGFGECEKCHRGGER
jgi:hypothetical protein